MFQSTLKVAQNVVLHTTGSTAGTSNSGKRGGEPLDPFKTRPGTVHPLRSLQYNVELLSHIVGLARRSTSAVQHEKFMDWAENVIVEMRAHPKLKDCG